MIKKSESDIKLMCIPQDALIGKIWIAEAVIKNSKQGI